MSTPAHLSRSLSATTANAILKRIYGQRRRVFNFGFRNPATGQFNSGQPIPSPAAMQQAYKPGASSVVPKAATTDLRTILAAAGTAPVKSHPKLLGPAAKSESENIGETIKRFLISRATKARP